MSSYFRRYLLTAASDLRRVREKRCLGRWADYIPWIKVHELSSDGWSTRAWSDKTSRIIHLLSRLEYLYFLRLEFSSEIEDFYEQFALRQEVTEDIAKTLRIRYPIAPFTGQKVRFTSDFVFNSKDGRRIVRACKPADALDDERVRLKLKIDKVYWQDIERCDDWAVVSRDQLNPEIDANIAWVWRMRNPTRLTNGAAQHIACAKEIARAMLLIKGSTLDQTAERLGREFGGRGTGTELLRHLLACGAFPEANFSVRFNLDRELPLLKNAT